MATIQRPIFIIGNIRSGTTVLYDLLAVHPELCWFSNLTDADPPRTALAPLHRLLDLPLLGRRLKRAMIERRRLPRFVPRPHEGDAIYHDYCGFGQDPDGLETRLTVEMETRLKETIIEHLRRTGKKRFLSKQTANNRRLALLERIFPDAFYIHSLRDGRAVASSTLRVPWWNDTHIWWLGYRASEWAKQGRPPIELAALYWKRTVEEIHGMAPRLAGRFIEIRYEDLTRDTRGVIGRILDFCGLPRVEGYMNIVPENLPDMNYKWKEALSEEEKEILRGCIGSSLEEMGYKI